jgi:hypothetical protein
MEAVADAPHPAYRLIPSKFPPIGLFDTVATAADLADVLDLVGWTNDRLMIERVSRLPRDEWVYGIQNASIVMASFLHFPTGGNRFSGPDLGAWYAAADIQTAAAEVAHHLRREMVAQSRSEMTRKYRTYSATLLGQYLDIRGQQADRPDVYASDRYDVSQALGEKVRSSGGSGILYDSLRLRGGINVAAHRPRNIKDVTQTDHFEITVLATSRIIDVRRLSSST